MKKRLFMYVCVCVCLFLFGCNTQQPPQVGSTKFVVTQIDPVDDYYSQYYVSRPSNASVASLINLMFTDTIEKFHVGDVLVMDKYRYTPPRPQVQQSQPDTVKK